MKSLKKKSVRRSVALPESLIAEVTRLAPAPLRGNLNRLVVVSLQEYAERRRAAAFESAMREMAGDSAIGRENERIAAEFGQTESDGLTK